MSFIFGLYQVPIDQVAEQMKMARSKGINRFDTAQLYGNEKVCAENCLPTDIITTKIYEGETPSKFNKNLNRSLEQFCHRVVPVGHFTIETLLFHRPLPVKCWKLLAETSIPSIGICNYELSELQFLCDFCHQEQIRFPSVHQMEIHPFIDTRELIQWCHDHRITVQGHTILAQGKYFDFPPLQELASKYHVTPAMIMTRWAISKDIDICIHTSKVEHLNQLLAAKDLKMEEADLENINGWHQITTHRFYRNLMVESVITTLKHDLTSSSPSSVCEQIPITGDKFRTIGRSIAEELYPELSSDQRLSRLRKDIKRLRALRMEVNQKEKQKKKGILNVSSTDSAEYSSLILDPRPMPVEITDPHEFIPFFDYIQSASDPPSEAKTFIRGTVFPDGRLDSCKQVVGPSSIQSLCHAVRKSKIIRHFLLGNNLALQEKEIDGASAIGSLMADPDVPIETWYLAGNCIGPGGIEIMAQSLYHNSHCKALWLKRNPIGIDGTKFLNSMLKINTHLVLLDLHNCGIQDQGLANLFSNPSEIKTLKHIYLDTNAIENLTPLCQWIQTQPPITSLYLSINRLGDSQIETLAQSLTNNPTLKRINLSSTQCGNPGFEAIVEMALTCPRLRVVNIGTYKSSKDMGEKVGNLYDDAVIPSLNRMIFRSTVRYINLVGSRITRTSDIMRTDTTSIDFGVGPSHIVHPKSQLRILKHPKRIVDIDSIYRNRM